MKLGSEMTARASSGHRPGPGPRMDPLESWRLSKVLPSFGMRRLLREAGFELVQEVPFQLCLNRLYVARKP